MIPAVLLCAAMAMPPTFVHHDYLTIGEVRVLHQIIREKKGVKVPRMLLIGTEVTWVNYFRGWFNAWRIEPIEKQTAYDIISAINSLPVRHGSIRALMYGYDEFGSQWNTMAMLMECVTAIEPEGYFLFMANKCPRFVEHLSRMGYFRLPIRWRGYSIYRKPFGRITFGGPRLRAISS